MSSKKKIKGEERTVTLSNCQVLNSVASFKLPGENLFSLWEAGLIDSASEVSVDMAR